MNYSIHQRKVVIFVFTLLCSSVIFILFGEVVRGNKSDSTGDRISFLGFVTPTSSPTKWWIKTKVTTSPIPTITITTTYPTEGGGIDCLSSYGSSLQLGKYAYISPVPPLTNCVRAGAGKAYDYLGQIQPGSGVKIIDGPLCANGFSWWLVETVESDLRGWTVGGSESEQWVLPCPNPAVACKMLPVIQQVTPTTTHAATPGNNDHTCTSNGIFIGMSTQVKEDNLLVVRSEPYTGSVIGHADPTSAVMIVDGPACAGGVVWWEVNVPSLNLTGWATEANLRPCTKEDDCT